MTNSSCIASYISEKHGVYFVTSLDRLMVVEKLIDYKINSGILNAYGDNLRDCEDLLDLPRTLRNIIYCDLYKS